jgi:hypothetical protein
MRTPTARRAAITPFLAAPILSAAFAAGTAFTAGTAKAATDDVAIERMPGSPYAVILPPAAAPVPVVQWQLVMVGSGKHLGGVGLGLSWHGRALPQTRIDRASEFRGLALVGDPANGKGAMVQVALSF